MKKPIQPIRQAQGKQVQGKRVYSGLDFYFDDCYVCQQTKKAEEEGKGLSAEELKEIFEKANTKN